LPHCTHSPPKVCNWVAISKSTGSLDLEIAITRVCRSIHVHFLRLVAGYRGCTMFDGSEMDVFPVSATHAGTARGTIAQLRPCIDTFKNLKFYKISYHIESCGTCMEHNLLSLVTL